MLENERGDARTRALTNPDGQCPNGVVSARSGPFRAKSVSVRLRGL